jgi:anti-sigma regulatory factor (Ser/Thr protein kinase)
MATRDDPPALLCVEDDIDASLEGMSDVHELLARFWQMVMHSSVSQPDATWRALFDSAAAEIAGNVVRHAFPPETAATRFHMSLCCFEDHIVATTTDHGIPCALPQAIRAPDMVLALEDVLLDHGWGLPIAQAATDALDYQRLPEGLNRWRIDKYFGP